MAEKNNSELINYNRKKQKGYMPVMLIIALAIGLLVGAMSFFISYKFMLDDSAGDIPEDSFSANDMAGQVQANLIGSDIDAVVKSVDESNKTIMFYNLKSETTITVTATDNTTYPANVNFKNIKQGDLYTYVFDENKNLTELKECKKQWVTEDVGLAVSTSAKMLKFTEQSEKHKNLSYRYVEGLTTLRYQNQIIDMTKLSPLDYVVVKGYDNGKSNKAYSVTIEKSHGELQIQNINYIDDVKFTINGEEYSPDEDDPRILLTEGTYNITISGDNCEDVKKEIVIDPTKPTVIDLSKVMIKSGTLDVYTNVDDCTVYVNNKEYKLGDTILLPYGDYTVKATKEGYLDAQGTVSIDTDSNYIELNLNKKDKIGTITVTTVPSTAQISIDDVPYATGTLTSDIALGSYVVSASANGYKTEKKQVNVTADGQKINVTFNLQKDE